MSGTTPAVPDGVSMVREAPGKVGAVDPEDGTFAIPVFEVPAWTERFPWLIHGTTGAAPDADFGLFGATPVGDAMARWRRLQDALGTSRAVHGRQVHSAEVIEHTNPDPGRAPGLAILDHADGHVTGVPGILVTVSLADCVPISLVDPDRRRVALLHGGWRGTASGIVDVGLRALGAKPGSVYAHLGPAICGGCYEVGPEVFEALELTAPETHRPVDLRAVQAGRLVGVGVPAEQISVSLWCTKHDRGWFSHRGGDHGRQLGVLGVR